MTHYILLQFGTLPPRNDEELSQTLSDWSAWFDEMGDRIIEGGSPLNYGGSVGELLTEENLLPGRSAGHTASGYSIIRAENMTEARALAEGCPTAKKGGRIDVYAVYPVMGTGGKNT